MGQESRKVRIGFLARATLLSDEDNHILESRHHFAMDVHNGATNELTQDQQGHSSFLSRPVSVLLSGEGERRPRYYSKQRLYLSRESRLSARRDRSVTASSVETSLSSSP